MNNVYEKNLSEEEKMQKRIRELVKQGEKVGLVVSYSDYIKTEEAKETAIPKEDVEYYRKMCENWNR